jgi:hypothetical protein
MRTTASMLHAAVLIPLPLLLVGGGARLCAAEDAGTATAAAPAPAGDLASQLDALKKQVDALSAQVQNQSDQQDTLAAKVDKNAAERDVDTSFAFGGYGLVEGDYLRWQGHTETAQFQPIFTYSYKDDLLFVGEMNLQTGQDPELTQAYLCYTKMSHAVIELGMFPLPFAAYSERLSPSWVNKFASAPPPSYGEAFGVFSADQTDVGAQVRGDVELPALRANYTVFVVAGPTYNASDGSDDRLAFGNNTGPTKVQPTVGTRIGIIPMTGLEIGLSGMRGEIANNVPAYNAGSAGQLDPTQGLISLPSAPSGNVQNPNAVYNQTDRRQFFGLGIDADYHVGSFVVRGEAIKVDLDDSAGVRVRSQGFYLQASDHLGFLTGWLGGFEPAIRIGAVTRNVPLDSVDHHGNPKQIKDVKELALGVNYYFASNIRSSLFVIGHNDPELDQASFVTTYGF